MGDLAGNPAVWTDDSRKIEAEQVALWEAKLLGVQSKPPEARPADLWLGLRNMGYRTTYDGHSPAVDVVYQKIQKELLAIPGHAKYFEERIDRMRKQCEGVPPRTGPRCEYDRQRDWALMTLRHLPSPETVGVLGRLLVDDSEFGPTDDPLLQPNSDLARGALEKLGLREIPREDSVVLEEGWWREARAHPENRLFPHPYSDNPRAMKAWRLWWDDVKNGRRTFSFVGQAVEYRFKPDGTWDTIPIANPPDDGPKPVAAAMPARNSQSPPVAVKPPPPGNSWPWIIGAAMIGLALVVWLGLRKSPTDP